MKKCWIVLALALLMLGCWTSAGAEVRYLCDVCLDYTEWTFTDCGDTHHAACTICGDAYDASHSVDCTDMTKCEECGTTVNLENAAVSHSPITEYVDETYHASTCACGEIFEKNPHYSEGYAIMKENESSHRIECMCSVEVYKFEAHTAYCSKDPTICYRCDAADVVTQTKHNLTKYTWVDQRYHRLSCQDCDYEDAKTEIHNVFCWWPHCMNCQSGDIDGVLLTEKDHFIEYHVTAATHQAYCSSNNCELYYDPEPHTFAGGVCTVCEYEKGSALPAIPGDADGNDSVTLNDALVILEGKVTNEECADVTGDGKVNEQDALRIMQYDSGWDVVLQ